MIKPTIKPTIIQKLEAKRDLYMAKREEYRDYDYNPDNGRFQSFPIPSCDIEKEEAEKREIVSRIRGDVSYIEKHLLYFRDKEANNNRERFWNYTCYAFLMDRRIEVIKEKIKEFTELHGEYDEALFTLWLS